MMNKEAIVNSLRLIFANLKQGLRGAFFKPAIFANIHATSAQLVGLTLTNIAIIFAWEFALVGPQGEFNSYGFPDVLFIVPVILFLSWALARQIKRTEYILTVAVLLSSIVAVIDALYPLIPWIFNLNPNRETSFYWGGFNVSLDAAWLTLASSVVMMRLFTLSTREKTTVLLITIVLLGVPLAKVNRYQTLWSASFDRQAYEERQKKRNILVSEKVFYLQPKLLARELAAVKPDISKGINLYFVGVAGYSEQDVFMKEVHYVSKLFKTRYGTSGHSVELINNAGTISESPIASVTSLDLSLKRIGEVMQKKKDILFLYLTSHGSQDHKFSLDFGSMQFNELNPHRLREMLDASGIKHRVIVISACYSGGFVDALKNDDTLIMTASAPDKQSFGCSNEADFTYFGNAYFADSLRKTDSFIDAFNLAKPVITERESKDHYDPSDPRIFIGANIRKSLDMFEKQRESHRPPSVNADGKINMHGQI